VDTGRQVDDKHVPEKEGTVCARFQRDYLERLRIIGLLKQQQFDMAGMTAVEGEVGTVP